MKKLGKLKLNSAKMLNHEELVSFRGGSGSGGSGTCGWNGGGVASPVCGISKEDAQALWWEFGGYWCCDSCCYTDYCYTPENCGYFV